MPNICSPNDNPDLKQIVDRTIALFAVYTGATLSFFVKDFLFSDENLEKYVGLTDWLHYFQVQPTGTVHCRSVAWRRFWADRLDLGHPRHAA
jgi:hypothetical protein